MDFISDESLVLAQSNLIKKRELILEQKRQLYEQFKDFALNKLRTHGKPFIVKYRAINGDFKKGYNDLSIGEAFLLEYASFTFNPKNNLLSNYVRTEFRETKTTEAFDELIETTTSRPHIFRKSQQTIMNANNLEKEKIEEMLQKKVDRILERIFSGELVFDSEEFRQLLDENAKLDERLQQLNTRIEALKIVNANFVTTIDLQLETSDRAIK